MTIQRFPSILAGEEAANAVAGPKNIRFESDEFVVSTGADYEAPVTGSMISISEFRDRFTKSELLAIANMAYAGDATTRYLLLKLQTNTSGMDLSGAETVGGVDYLIAKGVLLPARRADILA